jgi:pyruvate dehydrogenase E2 component (dihydrolipoamide acetyltransferase)
MAIDIRMPALSPTMTEGKLAKWLKAEGETVKSGDLLFEIETDKATMEVEAADDGILGKIVIAAGTEKVAVNSVVGVLLAPGETLPERSAAAASAPQAVPIPVSQAPLSQAPAVVQPGSRIFASPLARRLARERGLDLASIRGSGPNGRIVKADLDQAPVTTPVAVPVAAPVVMVPQPMPVSQAAYTASPNSTMRKTIARRLSEAKQTVPHFYLTVECAIDALMKLRADLNARAGEGVRISLNDLVIKAAALALRRIPGANASWSEEAIRLYTAVDVSVAVATPQGLITPILRNADQKGLATLSSEMKALAERAKAGKLQPEEYQGGGFTISNLGMYGITEFSAIINPPQACILAVGAGIERAVVREGALAIATVMNVTLSVDHRAVDGVLGAQYLAAFKALIEDPIRLML